MDIEQQLFAAAGNMTSIINSCGGYLQLPTPNGLTLFDAGHIGSTETTFDKLFQGEQLI